MVNMNSPEKSVARSVYPIEKNIKNWRNHVSPFFGVTSVAVFVYDSIEAPPVIFARIFNPIKVSKTTFWFWYSLQI